MASSEKVDLRVSSNNPEPVALTLERIDCCPLIQVPDPDGLVFANRENEVLVGVEEAPTDVLEMATASIDLPL
jgi:hypothetical protein